MGARRLVRRILLRLEQAEANDINPHAQDDYRIAWLTVLHAWHGHRDPHVAACYTTLGLHPDKVWPAIIARRKAMLGAAYESFFAEQPSLASLYAELPPKKPPQPVRVELESVRRKIAAGGESSVWPGGRDERKLGQKRTAQVEGLRRDVLHLETPNMASTHVAYDNPNASTRAKNAGSEPFTRLDRVLVSTAPSHLQNTLRWILSFNFLGTELWPSTDSIAVAAFKSRRTIQRHLDELVEELYDCQECTNRQAPSSRKRCRRCGSEDIKPTGLHILEMIEHPNSWVRYGGKRSWRYSATYRFHPQALTPRKTYEQYAAERDAARPKRVQSTQTKAPAAPPPPAPALVPKPAPPAEKIRLLRSGQAAKLVALVKVYKHGRAHIGEGMGRKLSPNDPEYRPPMSQYDAIVAACEELGYQLQAALEYLKLVPGSNVGDA